jgi:hypothetical protein
MRHEFKIVANSITPGVIEWWKESNSLLASHLVSNLLTLVVNSIEITMILNTEPEKKNCQLFSGRDMGLSHLTFHISLFLNTLRSKN